jgi:hypothetical protein
MHELDKPYTDSIQQWDIACDCFKAEFKFDPNEIVTIDTIREMFAEIVDDHELSQNASISLMFALYFLGYITLLEIMKAKDETFEIGDMTDFYLILDRADQWAHQSDNANLLAQAAAPIIQATQQIMQKLNLVR